MPIAQLDVINLALAELGQLPITNANDTPAGQLLQLKLNVLLPEMLLTTDWNFAIKYVSNSTPLTMQFSPDYLFNYELPPDYNRMDRFSWSGSGMAFGFYYRIIDGMILTNVNPIQYYYVVNNADYSVLTPLFYRALSLYAAADSCMVLTQKESLTKFLEAKYQQKLAQAILQNDMERYVSSAPYNDFSRQAYI